MKNRVIFSLYKKEMLDILRDKKTVIIMILVPVILYPLLFLGAMVAGNAIVKNQQASTYQVAFYQVAEAENIEKIMMDETDELDYHFEVADCEDWKKALEEKKIDVCITEEQKGSQAVYQIQYLSSVSDSATAASMMKDIITEYREQLRKTAIEEKGLDVTAILYPVEAESVDLSSDEETFGSLIGSLLPFLMITSILLGAIYPAIDVTAGEKERGTLETLLTLPVSNYELIMSKFMAVSTLSSVSALLNFVSVGMIGGFMYQSVKTSGVIGKNIQLGSFIPAVLIMLVCVLVFAMFLSALCLCICIFAKSFKEAQNYSTPLLLVVMLTGYVGFIPGVELNATYAIIPVANIVLLVKNIFTFQYSFGNLFLVLITNIVYTFLAIALMSKMYNSESVLFGEGGSVKLFESRANMKKGQMPGIGDAFLLLAVSVLAMFYIGSYAQMKFGFWGIPVQQILFLGLPVGFAWYMKADYKKVFSLKVPKVTSVIGSFFLWLGTYLAIILMTMPLQEIFKEDAGQLNALNDWFAEQPVWAMLLVVGILPAICEETLFRGFLFGTMKEKWKPVTAIIVSGVIFGVYHMSIIKSITISVLGMALAYSVYCSGSIATSILMHFCNNTIAVLLYRYPEPLKKACSFLFEEKLSVPVCAGLEAAAVVFAAAGIWMLGKSKQKVKSLSSAE